MLLFFFVSANTAADHHLVEVEWVLVVLFVVTVLALGRWRGLGALAGLALTSKQREGGGLRMSCFLGGSPSQYASPTLATPPTVLPRSLRPPARHPPACCRG